MSPAPWAVHFGRSRTPTPYHLAPAARHPPKTGGAGPSLMNAALAARVRQLA